MNSQPAFTQLHIPDESDHGSGVKPTAIPIWIRLTFRWQATIVTSQLPIKAWHDAMQDPTLADAILDRLVHNAYKVELKGVSMRKKRATLDHKTQNVTDCLR